MANETFDKEAGSAPIVEEQPERPEETEDAADETTGASPGTAQACDDLGLNSLEANLAKFGIKPPGMA